MSDEQALLLNMNIGETSGVDHPANKEEGWLLMKQAGIASVDDLAAALVIEEALMKNEDSLVKAIEGVDLAEAPRHVRAAATVLRKFMKARYAVDEKTEDGDAHEEENDEGKDNQMPASSHVSKVAKEAGGALSATAPPAVAAASEGKVKKDDDDESELEMGKAKADGSSSHRPGVGPMGGNGELVVKGKANKDPNDNGDPDSATGIGTEATAAVMSKKLLADGYDDHADGFGAHSTGVPTSQKDEKRPSWVETAIARVLGRSLNKAVSAEPAPAMFDRDLALLKALQAAWPEFCGVASQVLKSQAAVPVRKAAMQAALGTLLLATQDGFQKAQLHYEYVELCKKKYSQEQRDRLTSEGKARPDGSFPIDDVEDLHNAISDWGRAGSDPADKAHIKAQARKLGVTDQLPDSWK